MISESNISAQNLLKNNVVKSFYSNIPGLKEEMLCASYWIKSLDMNEIIMNSEEQGKLIKADFYEMDEAMTIENRGIILDSLVPGIALYMSGHTMIYLGNDEGIHYAIHDFSGFYDAKKDGAIEYHKSRQVMVAPLNIGLSEDGKTYIEGIY